MQGRRESEEPHEKAESIFLNQGRCMCGSLEAGEAAKPGSYSFGLISLSLSCDLSLSPCCLCDESVSVCLSLPLSICLSVVKSWLHHPIHLSSNCTHCAVRCSFWGDFWA